MKKLKILAILFIIMGIIIFFFPQMSNYIYENNVEAEKDKFVKTTEDNSNNMLEQLYNDLKQKNEELYRAAHQYTQQEQQESGVLTKAVVEDIKENLDDI